MKKIFTLIIAAGCLGSVYAQSGHDSRDYNNGRNNQNRDYAYSDRRDNNYSSTRERVFQIEKTNREIEYRINAVRDNRYIRNGEKRRMIRSLEIERAARIRQINDRYNINRYDRNDSYRH